MGLNHGITDMVKDQLAFCFDAYNKSSYSGTGTDAYDISGNYRNGVLTNGPIYNSGNGGYLNFDSNDDYVNVDTLTEQTNSSLSVFAWVYLNSPITAGVKGIWGHYGTTGTNNCHFECYAGYTRIRLGTYNDITLPVFTSGSWQYVGFTSTGTVHKYYINGTLISTGTGATGAILGRFSSISHFFGRSDNGRTWDGRIARVEVYTKELSQAEISQNFNLVKGRYGL